MAPPFFPTKCLGDILFVLNHSYYIINAPLRSPKCVVHNRHLRFAVPRCVARSPQKGGNPESDGIVIRRLSASASASASASVPETETTRGEISAIIFVDESSGERIPVMPADYGFRSGSGRLYQDDYGSVPRNAFALGIDNFRKELLALRQSVRFDEYKEISSRQIAAGAGPLRKAGLALGGLVRGAFSSIDRWLEAQEVVKTLNVPVNARNQDLTPAQQEVLDKVCRLKLDDKKVAEREGRRENEGDKVDAPWPIKVTYVTLCWALDQLYAGRPIQRFWMLETVARMPYFAFLSMLHLYESLGWWRAGAELRKVHFAEEWNELHHLQIMEALGGDLLWVDRFLAEHAAVFYYWVLILMYLVSPPASYAFSELVENHAVDTYSEFVEQNEDLLKSIPPPLVALNYYKSGDLYLFDQLQTGWRAAETRRPSCSSLYDVFVNIRDDELEHVKTMSACKDGSIMNELSDGDMARGVVGGTIKTITSNYDCGAAGEKK